MHFLRIYSDKNKKNILGFSEDAMQALVSYDWAGNVRELENAVERAVVFTNSDMVPLSVLPQFMPDFADLRHALKFKIGTPWRELESQCHRDYACPNATSRLRRGCLGCHLAQYVASWIENRGAANRYRRASFRRLRP
jgi:DNA-binding NtrC family response regulator